MLVVFSFLCPSGSAWTPLAAAETAERSGAIRLLAVLPAFLGLLVGRRLLRRVEEAMCLAACTRALCCVPEHRQSMLHWARRRGFETSGVAEFPAALRKTHSRATRLQVLAKSLRSGSRCDDCPAGSPRRVLT